LPPTLSASPCAKQKVLDNELAFARRKWSAAGTAVDCAILGFRTSLDFDDLIERVAVRTIE